jgi:DNA (cytosine-5)-methyltransferase 1
VINSRHWLPQYRERVYMVGFRTDLKVAQRFEWNKVSPPVEVERNSVRSILDTSADAIEVERNSVRSILDTSADAIEAARLTPAQQLVVEQSAQEEYDRLIKKPDHITPWSLKAIDIDDKAPTLISNYHGVSNFSSKFIFDENTTIEDSTTGEHHRTCRFLTPRECARLMGFPEEFIIVNEDTEEGRGLFYKQIGNAVCPPVIESLSKQMLKCLTC